MTTVVSESEEDFTVGGNGCGFLDSGGVRLGQHRSRPLHNFNFPSLSWGCHRLFRCSNNRASTSPESVPPIYDSQVKSTVRSQLIPQSESGSDLKESDKINAEIAGDEDGLNTAAMPWNLRTRRAACNAPSPPTPESLQKKRKKNGNGNSTYSSDRLSPPSLVPPSPLRSNYGRLRSENRYKEKEEKAEKEERRYFSVSLMKEEIEEDYLILKGSKPPRRPKKRLRIVQRQLDTLFPGLWLTEVTPETYKLQEV